MNFNEYQAAALRTAKMFPTRGENMKHAALGMITESGEFVTCVKRIEIYGKSLDDQMRGHMIEELGDFMWYVSLGAHAIGFTLQGVYDADLDQPDVSAEELKLDVLSLSMSIFPIAFTAATMAEMEGETKWKPMDVAESLSSAIKGIGLMCRLLDTTLEEVMIGNIAKLRARFPEKYSDQAAEARADKDGLDARSS